MDFAFFEIIDPHDQRVIQRIGVLSRTEQERLRANGYKVVRRTLDRTLWPWLLNTDAAHAAD